VQPHPDREVDSNFGDGIVAVLASIPQAPAVSIAEACR
jgi:hypothetical protein